MRVRDQLVMTKEFSDSAREAAAEARRKQKEPAKWNLKIHVNRPGGSAQVDSISNVEYPQDGGRSLAEAAAKKYGVRPADISISFDPVK